jgi:hypothetical protein
MEVAMAAGHSDNQKGGARPSGMGSEATEGVHGAGGRSEKDNSSVTASRAEGSKDQKGSEPLEESTQQHRSGYGGSGGKPVASSDYHESNDPKR